MEDENLYLNTAEYAVKHGEFHLWHYSYVRNMCVKRLFDKYAERYYQSCRMKTLMEYLVEHYGMMRTLYVLAMAIQLRAPEIQLSPDVRDRAAKFKYSEDSAYDYAVGAEVAALNDAYLKLIAIEKERMNIRV